MTAWRLYEISLLVWRNISFHTSAKRAKDNHFHIGQQSLSTSWPKMVYKPLGVSVTFAYRNLSLYK